MAEQSEHRPEGRFPTIEIDRVRRALRSWSLQVAEAFDVTPRMRRVRFTAADLSDMSWRPGQDLVLSLPQSDGEIARRHYTIRALDGAKLDIDFVLHGEAPATKWARRARPGDVVVAEGPRGRTGVNAEANRHWFVGDETCVPAIFAMAAVLPKRVKATILIEINDDADRQDISTPADVDLHWIMRNGEHPGPSDLLLDRLKILAPAPEGAHAYIIGETSNVRAQRHFLVERGFAREQITAEGYWRPGRIGGHDHV